MEDVIIDVDPDKASVTIEVRDRREGVRGAGRVGMGKAGYQQPLRDTLIEVWRSRAALKPRRRYGLGDLLDIPLLEFFLTQ